MTEPYRYSLSVDRGGTFTDCVLADARDGTVRATKILSSDDAPVHGLRELLGIDHETPLPPCDVRIGTTLATNALLERKGARVALVVTRGFRDLLRIGDQARPSLFSLGATRPPPLTDHVIEVDGRLDASGRLLDTLDVHAVETALRDARCAGIEAVAVALLHAHVDGAVEAAVGAIADRLGFRTVVLSHALVPELGLLARADTAVADAYLTPVLARYVAHLRERMPGSRIRFLQSSGGLCDADRFRGRDAVLSGPAGGVIATWNVAKSLGLARVLGFDMGGTSTDVCRLEGAPVPTYGRTVGGVRLRAPMVAVHRVAAGGGSLCRIDGGRLVVGPESAGARPGPLCYGDPSATDLALTDVALVLGRIPEGHFPFPLHRDRAEAGLVRAVAALRLGGIERTPLALAEGFLTVAVEAMAAAIRNVSVARGHDPRDHAMVVFGGAGGQYACAVARRLGIRTLVFHPLASVFSAYGIGAARLAVHAEADAGRRELDATRASELEARFASLEDEARAALVSDGAEAARIVFERRVDLRHPRAEAVLSVPYGSPDEIVARFHAEHARTFGYARAHLPIEVVTLRVEACEDVDPRELAPDALLQRTESRVELVIDGERHEVPCVPRDALRPGQSIAGPALLVDPTSTIVLDPGFVATKRDDGVVLVEDRAVPRREAHGAELDPVRLAVTSHAFTSVAEQMGAVLQRTAQSTNIRDRLDFSCAVFAKDGALVANAPHIPVHLGAMSESVRAVHRAHPAPRPGDVFVTNDPATGGSHLPDITVVSPVHDDDGALRFWVASRGHHADVGGITPGSMPAFSRSLDEEGVVLRELRIVSEGRFDEAVVRQALSSATHPARRPDENVADLEAQIAANRRGVAGMRELCERFGEPVVTAYVEHVQASAADSVRAALARLPRGTRRFSDALDDGTSIVVTMTIGAGAMEIDFSGTGPASAGNQNAPRSVTTSAVLYVLRTMLGRDVPLNAGFLRPVRLVVPEGSVLAPPPGAAVSSGNVETSQRVVDVLLGGLGLAAASQGTMNNVAFGDATFGYYETLGGGAGATQDAPGGSAVHTHMTNSRLTDPEVLEARFPVRLRTVAVRAGSGGDGRHRGGDGLVREYEILRDLVVSVVSERRVLAPWGAEGGGTGAKGVCFVDGRVRPGRFEEELRAGQVLRIETPGGGGWGTPPNSAVPLD